MYMNSNRTSLAHKIKTPIHSVTQKETKLVPLSYAETTKRKMVTVPREEVTNLNSQTQYKKGLFLI